MKSKDGKRRKGTDHKIQTLMSPTMADMVAMRPNINADDLEKDIKLLQSRSVPDATQDVPEETTPSQSRPQTPPKSTTMSKTSAKNTSEKSKSGAESSPTPAESTSHHTHVDWNLDAAATGSDKRSDGHSGSDKQPSEYSGSDKRSHEHSGSEKRSHKHLGSEKRSHEHSGSDKRSHKHLGSDKRSNQHSGSGKRSRKHQGSGTRSDQHEGSGLTSPEQSDSYEDSPEQSDSNEQSQQQSGSEKHSRQSPGSEKVSSKNAGSEKRSNQHQASEKRSHKRSSSAKRSSQHSSSKTSNSSGKETLVCIPLDADANPWESEEMAGHERHVQPLSSSDCTETYDQESHHQHSGSLPRIEEHDQFQKTKGRRRRKGAKVDRIFRGWDTGTLGPHTFDNLPTYPEIIPHIQMYIDRYVLKPDPVPRVQLTLSPDLSPGEYLARHHIEDIFEILYVGLLTARPQAPLDYLLGAMAMWSAQMRSKLHPVDDYSHCCRLPALTGSTRSASPLPIELFSKLAAMDECDNTLPSLLNQL